MYTVIENQVDNLKWTLLFEKKFIWPDNYRP